MDLQELIAKVLDSHNLEWGGNEACLISDPGYVALTVAEDIADQACHKDALLTIALALRFTHRELRWMRGILSQHHEESQVMCQAITAALVEMGEE